VAVSERMCPTEKYLDGLRTRTRQLLSLLLLEGAGGTHAAPIPLHAAAWGRQQRTLRLRTLHTRSSSSFICHLHFVSVRIVSAHRLPRNTENQSRESVESAQPIFDLRLCNSPLSIRMHFRYRVLPHAVRRNFEFSGLVQPPGLEVLEQFQVDIGRAFFAAPEHCRRRPDQRLAADAAARTLLVPRRRRGNARSR
jgi:hypothetical protein